MALRMPLHQANVNDPLMGQFRRWKQKLVSQKVVKGMQRSFDRQARISCKNSLATSLNVRETQKRPAKEISAPPFIQLCQERGAKPLKRDPATILQLNIGLYCNQACSHCHVESSPLRTEMMDRDTAKRCLELLRNQGRNKIHTLDLTGGAPELNSQFRFLVKEARALGLEVIDRCNLTVLLEAGQEDLVEFLAENQVRVVASLPCYSPENVNQQRGGGVFERSIKGLKLLNEAGYGKKGGSLILDLVYNPNGAFLAPSQAILQEAYQSELNEAFGIEFNNLFCLNNVPIKRFSEYLQRHGKLQEYMQLLVDNFNVSATEGLMCRDTISVSWDGSLYDCDFNQQSEIGMSLKGVATAPTVFSIDNFDQLIGAQIQCGSHCFACTAGAGSSCQGATS